MTTFGQLNRGQRFIAAPGLGHEYSAEKPAFVFMKLTPIQPTQVFNAVNLTTGNVGTWENLESVIPVAS